MADPRSYRISQAIVARIATIRAASGFVSDIGGNVLEGRESIDTQSDTFPLVSYIEGEAKPTARNGNRVTLEREVYIDAYDAVPSDSTILKHGHAIRADILKALLPLSAALNGNDILAQQPGLVNEFTYEGDAVLASESDNVVNTVVAFKVKWTENVSNPMD